MSIWAENVKAITKEIRMRRNVHDVGDAADEQDVHVLPAR
jgi:hypothetical protein